MAEESIGGKMELSFRAIFGSEKEKAKELFFIPMVREFKAIGVMM